MRKALGITSGYGLLTVTGNEHRQMRRAINPAFAIPHLMNRALIILSSRQVYPLPIVEVDMYYDSIEKCELFSLVFPLISYLRMRDFRLVSILQDQVASAPAKGKVINMYEWSALLYFSLFSSLY